MKIITQETKDKINNLHRDGFKNNEIAVMVGCSIGSVKKYIVDEEQIKKHPNTNKRLCYKCHYSEMIPSGCVCMYITIKGERRGCPAIDCDKFEPFKKDRFERNKDMRKCRTYAARKSNRQKEAFRNNIKRIREERGLSIRAVSEMMHISNSTWLKWEQGAIVPTNKNLWNIGRLFHVKPEDLFKD